VFAAACSGFDVPKLPVNPGGSGGGPGGAHGDAGADSGDGGATLAGRVCLLPDPRDLTACAATGAGGLTVALGSQSATTADDGTFVIAAAQGTNLVWHVTGASIVTSVMPASLVASVPAIAVATFGNLATSIGMLFNVDQGQLMATIVQAGAPLANAAATTSPAAQYPTLYDDPASASVWGVKGTGAHGTAWVPGLDAGTAALSITPMGGSATAVGAFPIEASSITFVVADLP
jgi:hypothetical protein